MADRNVDVPAIPEIRYLAPGVVLAHCPKPGSFTGVVTMVVAKGDTVLVIDSGLPEHMPDALLPALHTLGVEVSDITAIAGTNGHRDHTGGGPSVHQLSGALMHFSADDAGLAGYHPHVDLRDGDTFDLGGLVFEVLATPGHTAGSLSFYEREQQLLIVGDAVRGTGSTRRLPPTTTPGGSTVPACNGGWTCPSKLSYSGTPLPQEACTAVFSEDRPAGIYSPPGRTLGL